MLQQFTPPKATNLALIRIFSIKDLGLFIVGIIFVSITSGSIGAFMLGVGAEEFFLGENENVVVVTQPGATTPFTGQVPLSLQSDIQQIPGVLAISPETLGLSVAQNLDEKSIIVRGVTANYTSFVSEQIIDGSWFNPRFGYSKKTILNGAMIGYVLAENLRLSVDDTLLLASTLAETVVEIVITGILKTDSPSDEELMVSLSLGQTMSGKISGFVSFLRVLIDTDVISKEVISQYLTQEFLVPISLFTDDPGLVTTLHEIPIIAYTPSGQHVKTQYIESGNTTYFHLRFGTYEFIASSPNTGQSPVLRIFVNQFFYTPFEISIGKIFHDISIQVLHNSNLAFNATVNIVERFRNQGIFSSKTNESGIAFFPDLPENAYNLSVYYHNLSFHSLFRVTQSVLISVNLDCTFSLIVRNYTSGIEINGGNFTILSLNGTNLFYTEDYISNTSIYLDPGNYQIKYQYSIYSHCFNLTIEGQLSRTIFLGTDKLNLWIRNSQKEGVPANISVQWPNKTSTSQITSLNGTTVFNLDVNKNYTIFASLLSNQSKIHTRIIDFKNQTTVIIDFFDFYELSVQVINGTDHDSHTNGLDGAYLEIRDDKTVITSGQTNSTGYFQFSFSDPGNYSILASNDGYSWNGYILIYNQTTHVRINLGKVCVAILTQSVSNVPIKNIEITLTNSSGYYSTVYTNASGFADFIVSIGNYTIKLSTLGFSSIYPLNLTESQILWMNITVELSGDLFLTLENQFYQKLDLAFVVLRSDYYDYEIKAFTDTTGKIRLLNIPWGNYSLFVIHNEDVYPKELISLVNHETELLIRIDTNGPILSGGNYAFWQDSSFSVVWSSEFVSGFLSSTLSLITTTLTTIVIIVSVLSLLSIASVISHPIVANGRTIRTFQYLGANRQQITFGFVLQLTLLGLIASLFGSVLGMWGMTFFPNFQHINIGGVIIRPRIDIWLVIAILLSNVAVILIKATQKVNELYSSYQPKID